MRHLQYLVAFALLGACGGNDTPAPDAGEDTLLVGSDIAPSDSISDLEETAPSELCDPVAQTGCHPSEQCTYIAANRTPSCFEKGPAHMGEPCAPSHRCELGVCLSVNATEAHCFQVCNVDSDCPSQHCMDTSFGAYRICENRAIYTPCELMQDGCSSDDEVVRGCYAVLHYDEPVCLPAGQRQEGESCGFANDCAAGLACRSDICRALCALDDAEGCPEEQNCREFRFGVGACEPLSP